MSDAWVPSNRDKNMEQIIRHFSDDAWNASTAVAYVSYSRRAAHAAIVAMGHDESTPLPLRESCATEEDDTVIASGTVTPDERPAPKIAMPHGYWMQRIATFFFFFSPKKIDRVFGEGIADYRNELHAAEAKGYSPRELLKLHIQHWGGFVLALIEELAGGLMGKIWKMLKGG